MPEDARGPAGALTQGSAAASGLLDSVGLPLLVLSNELRILHFTAPAQHLLNVRPSDIGRPFGELRINLSVDSLEPILLDVVEKHHARDMEVQDRDGGWHLLRVRPCVEGLSVVLVDIDQLPDARDFARLILEKAPLPLIVVDSDYRIYAANEAFAGLSGSSIAGLENRGFLDVAKSLWGLDEPLRSPLMELRAGNRPDGTFEFEHRTGGEPPRVLSIHGRLLRWKRGAFLLVTVQDNTARHEAEHLLDEQRAALAARIESATGELARGIEELRALARSLFTSQENERRTVARQLHDDISQRLARMEMDAEELARQIERSPADAKARVAELRGAIGALSRHVRAISHRLYPSIVEDLGIGAALRSLTDDFREHERMIATYFEEDVPEALPNAVATGLYRIAEEALRNVARHAGKTHVKVTLRASAGTLRLGIVDAGFGFDPEDTRWGVGLIGAAERARQFGATLRVESALGEGTRVVVETPLAERA